MIRRPPRSTLFPTRRSSDLAARVAAKNGLKIFTVGVGSANGELIPAMDETGGTQFTRDESGQFVKSRLDERSEEHTSELQSHSELVCRLLLEKKKKNMNMTK